MEYFAAYGIPLSVIDNREASRNGSSHAFARVMQDFCQSQAFSKIASDYTSGKRVVVIDVGAKFGSVENLLAKMVKPPALTDYKKADGLVGVELDAYHDI